MTTLASLAQRSFLFLHAFFGHTYKLWFTFSIVVTCRAVMRRALLLLGFVVSPDGRFKAMTVAIHVADLMNTFWKAADSLLHRTLFVSNANSPGKKKKSYTRGCLPLLCDAFIWSTAKGCQRETLRLLFRMKHVQPHCRSASHNFTRR